MFLKVDKPDSNYSNVNDCFISWKCFSFDGIKKQLQVEEYLWSRQLTCDLTICFRYNTDENYTLYYNDYVKLYRDVIYKIIQKEDPRRPFIAISKILKTLKM
jgi:hypothetical protein